MYKVLLVDDERIICEGIASIIDWQKHDFILTDTAKNGIEASEMIELYTPQIVITDIKMPVLDGLELIARQTKLHPEIVFVVLSGYGEFDLASKAMKYGVRHYLLKPCNENRIIQVLEEIKEELMKKELHEELMKRNTQRFEKVLPLVKEQFLRDFLMERSYTKDEMAYYCSIFDITDKKMRLVLFQPEEKYSFEELLSLMNIINEQADKIVGKNAVYFNTIIKDQILILLKNINNEVMSRFIKKIRESFICYSRNGIKVSYSEAIDFKDTPAAYKEMQEYLEYSFCKEERGSIAGESYKCYTDMNNRYSKLVRTMIKHINDNISNEELTLKWLADKVMYMNVGYLGKIFTKETGEKFSCYVMKLRIKKAKELIEACEDDKVYEVAEKVGLGDNPQYFSQVFKKYTGFTPSGYKKKHSKYSHMDFENVHFFEQ